MIERMKKVASKRELNRKMRIIWMLIVGLVAAFIAWSIGAWQFAPAAGWTAAALLYNVWVWTTIAPMDSARTQSHAKEEDPGRKFSDAMILLAAVVSLAAVALVMIYASHAVGGQRVFLALLALSCTAMSWLMVHTLFTLDYAEIYYTGTPGGIEFNQEELPQYTDIAYMAFSVGMTYQVSDTNITTGVMRLAVFKHSLLAFLFGTGILATTINLVVSLI